MSRTKWVVLVLVVLLSPKPAGAGGGFTDVAPGSTHQQGIEWVADQGITRGCEPGRYCPNEPVTRAQMATFLYRMAQTEQPTVLAATIQAPTVYMAGLVAPHGTVDELPEQPVQLDRYGGVTVYGSCTEHWISGLIPGQPVPNPIPHFPGPIYAKVWLDHDGPDDDGQQLQGDIVFAKDQAWKIETKAWEPAFVPDGYDCWVTWTVTELNVIGAP